MSSRRILFFTNSDYGQANVVLATIHSLLHQDPAVEIHIASFHELQAAVREASDFAIRTAPDESSRKPVVFHGMAGLTWGPALFRPETGVADANQLKPGLVNSTKAVLTLPAIMLPWTAEEYIEIYSETERVLAEVNPDLTVVEPLFTTALTVCHRRQLRWMVLAPNTVKDFALPLQPRLAMLWKYPLVCSAMPYPLTASLIPRNIFLTLVAGYALVTDTRVKKITAALHEVDPSASLLTANELGVLKPAPPGLRILVANSPDIDFPFAVLPKHVTPCGPIVRAALPVADVDPELASWLSRGPTVYVNLGTQLKVVPEEAEEMAQALRSVLERSARKEAVGKNGDMVRLQILWKLARKPQEGVAKLVKDVYDGPWKKVIDVLRPYVDADRVRITEWVKAEPKSVLESGAIVCSVNHGGASSFNEALCAGIPQAVLPAWADCYDFANRAELLGVGRWANREARPRWERNELSAVLSDVLFGPGAETIQTKAREIAHCHPESEGRENAAREILTELAA
ncbi:hypothetical protein VTK73DRAFT_3093 [Phialemonium thermophilum]|uniref:UDP-glucoronosyl and UDP-glucosyl transferase family protein n=1 Tax=Phialemonium thermophilum TaxID=223376 RepID=A0ABR3X0G2_9PEZI